MAPTPRPPAATVAETTPVHDQVDDIVSRTQASMEEAGRDAALERTIPQGVDRTSVIALAEHMSQVRHLAIADELVRQGHNGQKPLEVREIFSDEMRAVGDRAVARSVSQLTHTTLPDGTSVPITAEMRRAATAYETAHSKALRNEILLKTYNGRWGFSAPEGEMGLLTPPDTTRMPRPDTDIVRS